MRQGYYRKEKTPEKFPDYGPGNCLYCGALLPIHRRKYCTTSHGYLYRIATARYRIVSWAEVRAEAMARDGNACQECHRKDLALEVHHKNPIFNAGDEFDLDNLITLCIYCHRKLRGKELIVITNSKIEQFSEGGSDSGKSSGL